MLDLIKDSDTYLYGLLLTDGHLSLDTRNRDREGNQDSLQRKGGWGVELLLNSSPVFL